MGSPGAVQAGGTNATAAPAVAPDDKRATPALPAPLKKIWSIFSHDSVVNATNVAPKAAPALTTNVGAALPAPAVCNSDLCTKMRAYIDQHKASMEAAHINTEKAKAFIDTPGLQPAQLEQELGNWGRAVARVEAERATSRPNAEIPPEVQAQPSTLPTQPLPLDPIDPSPTVPKTETINRARIPMPTSKKDADLAPLLADLHKLGYATGGTRKWDVASAEAYKDFVSNAIDAGKLKPEDVLPPPTATAADKKLAEQKVRALAQQQAGLATPDEGIRANAAQATIQGTVAAGGRNNNPQDVRKLQLQLVSKGFMPDDKEAARLEIQRGIVGPVTTQAMRTYIASYRGLGATTTARAVFSNGDPLTRSLFSNPKDTPHLADSPRWVHVQEQPDKGIYYMPNRPMSTWGSQRTEKMLQGMSADLRASYDPSYKIFINDMSTRTGGAFKPHHLHQNGLDVDIDYPERPDDRAGAAKWDRDRAAELRAAARQPNVNVIFTSRRELLDIARKEGIPARYVGGHMGHMHVNMKPWSADTQEVAAHARPRAVRSAGRYNGGGRHRYGGTRHAVSTRQTRVSNGGHRAYHGRRRRA